MTDPSVGGIQANGSSRRTYQRKRGLSAKQYVAIGLHLEGKTDGQVARALGIHRVTAARWRLNDSTYQAELNARREAFTRETSERALRMRALALSTIAKAMKEGDAQVALRFYLATEGLGRDSQRPGADSPNLLDWDWALQEAFITRGYPSDGPLREMLEKRIARRRHQVDKWEIELEEGIELAQDAREELIAPDSSGPPAVLRLLHDAVGHAYLALTLSPGEGIRALAEADQAEQAAELDRGIALIRREEWRLDPGLEGRSPTTTNLLDWIRDMAQALRLFVEALAPGGSGHHQRGVRLLFEAAQEEATRAIESADPGTLGLSLECIQRAVESFLEALDAGLEDAEGGGIREDRRV